MKRLSNSQQYLDADTDSNAGEDLSDEGLDISQRLCDTLFQSNVDLTSDLASEEVINGKQNPQIYTLLSIDNSFCLL